MTMKLSGSNQWHRISLAAGYQWHPSGTGIKDQKVSLDNYVQQVCEQYQIMWVSDMLEDRDERERRTGWTSNLTGNSWNVFACLQGHITLSCIWASATLYNSTDCGQRSRKNLIRKNLGVLVDDGLGMAKKPNCLPGCQQESNQQAVELTQPFCLVPVGRYMGIMPCLGLLAKKNINIVKHVTGEAEWSEFLHSQRAQGCILLSNGQE